MQTPLSVPQRGPNAVEDHPAAAHRLSANALLLVIGAGVALFHILTNGQHGFHRDELDILMNARRLDWAYISYPALTPFLARIEWELFGASLAGMRLLPALAQGVVVVLAGLMARDFGGGRLAQVIAALAVAISPMALTSGMLIQYMSFDFLWWVLLSFFLVRLLRSEDPRWWLGVGAAIGLGMITKYTMAFFVAGLIVAVLITSTRRYLRSPWLWAGVGLALLIFLPTLLWHAAHDFIALDYMSAIHARDIEWGRTDDFLLDQLVEASNPFAVPLWLAGLYFIFRSPAGKRFRPLGWMFLMTFVLLLVSRGRGYYLGPAYPMLLAAGATWFDSWRLTLSPRAGRLALGGMATLLAVGAVIAVLIAKPVAPIESSLGRMALEANGELAEMVGWPELAQAVADIYTGLPADQQAATAVLAGNYGEAGALDLYGPALGLPPVISGVNSMWARGYGDPPPRTVIMVGIDRGFATGNFSSCTPAGRISNPYGVVNEESEHHSIIYLCGEPHRSWAEIWPALRRYQ